MGALGNDKIGMDPVTDLDEIALARKDFHSRGYDMPLQPAELAAGLTQEDVDAQLS